MSTGKIERISPVATRSMHERITLIDRATISRKAVDAAQSPRKREIHIYHTGDEDTLQRMLNAIEPGSYVTPHRHADPPKAESLILLQGRLGCVCFDDAGTPDIAGSILLDCSTGAVGLDLRAGVWHTIFALEPETVVFEAKPGPYDPSCDKGFAPWAPSEGEPGAGEYLADLESRFREFWNLLPQ